MKRPTGRAVRRQVRTVDRQIPGEQVDQQTDTGPVTAGGVRPDRADSVGGSH